ncbi:hypothetical protein F5141DRAFT_1066121 [Pisolithus sp. B1]|nr:hypothetical protein F5141DRAFT_1066121 [Pisolithus sp. B1]
MSEQQQWRIVDIVPISPRKQLRPYSPSPADNGSSSSESRSEAPHCPSMEGSASMDQSVNIPTPPGGGSVDQMAAMCSVLIPTPPGTANAPHTDRMEAMHRATIPTPPAGSPAPHMDRMVAMCNATIPPPPTCTPATQTDKMAAMQSVAIPLPPVAPAALPPQPPPTSNLERMKMVVIPIPPSMAPAPNMDWLERMHNVAIPHAPSSRMEMMDVQPQPSLNTDHPQQSTSTKVTNSQRQPCMIIGEDINQGDMPTLEEHQALEQAELATSDADDDFLCVLHTFKSWHGAGFPPLNIPYDKDLDGHIMWAMRWISADIQHLVRSQVQHVEAGQYMVDMIDLLEVSQHPHVGYGLQSYTGEDQAQFQDEVRQIPLSTFWMINQISHFIPNWTPRSSNKYAGFVFPWWVDRSPQYHAEFQQMRGTRIFPIAHEYFQHTWPLQWLSMGDQIDEWMEEKVSAYMITARSVAGRTYGVKYIMEFQLTDVHFAACNPGIAIIVPGLYQNCRLRLAIMDTLVYTKFHIGKMEDISVSPHCYFNSHDTSGWKFGSCPHVTKT